MDIMNIKTQMGKEIVVRILFQSRIESIIKAMEDCGDVAFQIGEAKKDLEIGHKILEKK